MKSVSKWAIVVLSVAGLGIYCAAPSVADSTTQPSADSQQATGTISGTVTKDGKPLANARVGLIVKARHAKGKKAGKNGAVNNESSTTQPSETAAKHHHPKPIATATTDANGKFTLNDVNVGDYVIIAGMRGEGRGHERVAVTAGQTTNIEISVSVPGEKNGSNNKQAHKLGL